MVTIVTNAHSRTQEASGLGACPICLQPVGSGGRGGFGKLSVRVISQEGSECCGEGILCTTNTSCLCIAKQEGGEGRQLQVVTRSLGQLEPFQGLWPVLLQRAACFIFVGPLMP